MNNLINILLLEDSSTDAEWIKHTILKGIKNCEFSIAKDKETYMRLLEENRFDVVLSDNDLPQYCAKEALQHLQKTGYNIPFIIVSGSMPEEFAAAIIKLGADDYIQKDRMTRLPTAIEAALRNRKSEKEKADALQKLVESEKQYRSLVERISDGFISLDTELRITFINPIAERYLNKSPGTTKGKVLFDEVSLDYAGSFYEAFHRALRSNVNIYLEEYLKSVQKYLSASIYPSETGISAYFRDITEKKRLEAKLQEQQRLEQIKLTASALEAQEKERNALGLELHDNVNQILVGTTIQLSLLKKKPEKVEEFIPVCIENIKAAIEENRKIAHGLVTPDMTVNGLLEQTIGLCETVLKTEGISSELDHEEFNEILLNNNQKVAIYRIVQEQFTNIIKYANAKLVKVHLSTTGNKIFKMIILDDGIGSEKINSKGIGLRNIASRLSVLNGTSVITTSAGNGFKIEIEIPI